MALTEHERRNLPAAAGGGVAASICCGLLAGWLAGVSCAAVFTAAWWIMHRRGWRA